MKTIAALVVILLVAGPVGAVVFTEDFEGFSLEGFTPEEKPDQDWYNYNEGEDIGNVTADAPILEGDQSFRVQGGPTGTTTDRFSQFTLARPAQLSWLNFTIQAEPPDNNTRGSAQVISVLSSSPIRRVVQFYVFCTNDTFTDACEFKVRFDNVDTTGQTLINETLGETRFTVAMDFDWFDGEYRLFVNGVDDGVFPFLDLPDNVARVRFSQYRIDKPIDVTFDEWQVVGAINGTGITEGDVATGIKNFADSVRFTTTGSKFFFGLIVFFILVAAVVAPIMALGLDNTVVPALGFLVVLVSLWLIDMEFWPDWVGIAAIIAASALIASLVRQFLMGVRDANGSGALVGATLGYFIIATTLLAFSGYATQSISVPTGPAQQTGLNETEEQSQTFVAAVTECVFNIVTLWQTDADCSTESRGSTWTKITDVIGDIYGWIRASLDWLFQLLAFRLPIPAIFNAMIVFPPAVALALTGLAIIRGSSG